MFPTLLKNDLSILVVPASSSKIEPYFFYFFSAKVKYMYKTAVPELLRRMSKFQTMEEAIEASEAAHASYSALESANKTKIS